MVFYYHSLNDFDEREDEPFHQRDLIKNTMKIHKRKGSRRKRIKKTLNRIRYNHLPYARRQIRTKINRTRYNKFPQWRKRVFKKRSIKKQIKKPSENKKVVVLFKAGWCGHCKTFLPAWNKLLSLFSNNKNVKLETVDENNPQEMLEIEKTHGIKLKPADGFPTITKFENGKETAFEGNRTEKDVSDWIEGQGIKKGGTRRRNTSFKM